jgi:hypothetical protein
VGSTSQHTIIAPYLTQHVAGLNGFFNILKASLHWPIQIVAGQTDYPSLAKVVQWQEKVGGNGSQERVSLLHNSISD